MKKPKKNSIDVLIDRLANEFSNIPNFHLTQTDETGNRLFNYIISKLSEIYDYKALYCNYFIPQTNKAIVDSRNAIKKSFYRKIIKVTDSQLKENYYETIRLGYVGLFHKIENFVKGLLNEVNLTFNNGKTGKESIEQYFKDNYDFSFKNWHANSVVHRINWICNSVKHRDSFPNEDKNLVYLDYLPDNEKIKIEQKEFQKDIDFVANDYLKFKLTQILRLAQFKMLKDDLPENLSPEMKVQIDKLEEMAKVLTQE
jgi:hypothetical protein